jgi:hypothetical protein
MKIREIIVEDTEIDITVKSNVHHDNNDGIPDSHQSATPGLRSHVNLDNSSPYHPWRFAAYFLGGAGAEDGKYHHEPKKDGPNGQSLVAAAYSDGERRILDQAARAFGVEARHVQLTPDGSTEVSDTHKVSPVRIRIRK